MARAHFQTHVNAVPQMFLLMKGGMASSVIGKGSTVSGSRLDLGRIRATGADSDHPAHFFTHTHREEDSKPTQENAATSVILLEEAKRRRWSSFFLGAVIVPFLLHLGFHQSLSGLRFGWWVF